MWRLLFFVNIIAVLLVSIDAHATTTNFHHITKGMNDNHVPLAELALYMTKRYISPKISTLVIMEKCKYCATRHHNFQSLLLEHFLIHFDASMTVQLFSGNPDERPWDYIIFIVDGIWAFEELRFNLPDTLHDREYYFFIILTFYTLDMTTHNGYVRDHLMRKIFENCRRFFVINVVILHEYPDNTFGFFTYTRRCGQALQVRKCNSYANGSLESDFLFPQRYFVLTNCTLRVCAHVYHPMFMFSGDRTNPNHTKNINRITGFEGDILTILAKTLNFNISMHFTNGTSLIGTHRNSSGCFGELQNRTAEVAIGAFGSNEQNRYIFTASITYHQSPFVFVVRSDLNFGTMKHLIFPFRWTVWLLIGLAMLVGICTIRTISGYTNPEIREFVMGPRNYSPVCKLLSIILGNPIATLPRRNFARFLLMSWMLATLVIRSAYQGKMFDALRASGPILLPSSIAELVKQKYMLISKDPVYFYPHNLTISRSYLTRRYMDVQEHKGRYTTISLIETLGYYNYKQWNTSRLVYVNEPIYMFQYVMYFRKHSIFKPIFDRKLKQLNSAGITSYLPEQYVKKKYLNMNVGVQTLPKISNSMLSGLYKLYYIMNMLAGFAFVCEMLSKRSQRIKRILDWVHRRPNDK